MSWKHSMLALAHRSGALRAAASAFGRGALRVLAYHRVTDPSEPGFDTFVGNVSATPSEFADQMEHVAERWNPVGMDQVAAAVSGRTPLPPRSVLVTFDDGYRDNLTAALPILEAFGIPATIFLATDHVGTGAPFWWDRVAWCFAHSTASMAELPAATAARWETGAERSRVAARYIEHLKSLREAEKLDAIDRLPASLGVTVPADMLPGLTLDWDEVRTMAGRGVAVGSHTCSHPILSRVDVDDARREIVASRDRVAEEVGEKPIGFAYPNGQPGDFTPEVVEAVADAGFEAAFTLLPGPGRSGEIASHPFEIRRVYVHHGDSVPRFAAKLSGLPRFVGALR